MSTGRILIVTPRFFGYEEDIAAEFRRQGFDVDLVDERPSNSAFMKALFRVRATALRRSVDRYFRSVVSNGKTGGYDLVLVIKGEVVPVWFLEKVKRDSPRAVIAFYTFDSLANSSNFSGLLPYFDHVYSFQPGAERLDPRFRLKHLFYTPDFHPRGDTLTRRFESAFIGTLHSDRYRLAKRLLSAFSNTFEHFYVQAPWYFALKRVFDRRFRAVARDEVRFNKLSRSEVAEVFRNSLSVIDIQHESQDGLTMRTFEVIASGAYLVTTNEFVRQTPVMQTGRVIVVDDSVSAGELAETLRALPVPGGAPKGFGRYALATWAAEFIALIDSPKSLE